MDWCVLFDSGAKWPFIMERITEIMWGELHEEKSVTILLDDLCTAGQGNILLRGLGFTLYYDVYSFDARQSEPWQSETIASVFLFHDDVESDAQDDFNRLSLSYLLASRPSSDIDVFLALVERVATAFQGRLVYNGRPATVVDIRKDFVFCVDFLLKEWGEEPGSESLRIMIEENHKS